MADKTSRGPPSPTAPRSGKLLRRSNSDRLRMHAPSSIKVAAPTTNCVSEWKMAIPLLSPLDPAVEIGQGEEDGVVVEEVAVAVAASGAEMRCSAWQHPAGPFYYEPVPPGAANFLLPHCA